MGVVTGAYGVEGAVKVEALTDFEDRFASGATLRLEGQDRRVEWSRRQGGGMIVKLDGIDTRTMAELHRGSYLEVEEPRPLPAGSYYPHQLVGLEVWTESGRRLGRLADVLQRPANDVWVADLDGVEQLVPATREAVKEVDLAAGRVVVADWLLEVEDA